MSHALFDKHRATIAGAVDAIHRRGYWATYSEVPSPKVDGEAAMDDGRRALDSRLGQQLALDQPGQTGWTSGERSPHGFALAVSYPLCAAQALADAGLKAMSGWPQIGAEGRTGICLEIPERLTSAASSWRTR